MIKPWMFAQNKNKLQVSRSQGCNALYFKGSMLQITLIIPTRQLSFKCYLKTKDLIKFQTSVQKIQFYLEARFTFHLIMFHLWKLVSPLEERTAAMKATS